MATSTPLSQPRLKTVKRLFAVSKNRCAFKGCKRRLVDAGGSVVGEICHIKGKRGGPRFDPSQTDEERHGYPNLILLCAAHHKVVDDNERIHTPELLSALKQSHEAKDLGVDVDDVAARLLANSGFIGDLNQTARDRGINVAAANSSVVVNTGASALNERRVEAAQALWKAVIAIRDAMPAFIGARLDIVTDAEYPAMYRSCQDLVRLFDEHEFAKALQNPGGVNVETFSPFLPAALWDQFVAYRIFVGRVCLLSIGKIGGGRHWIRDERAMEALRTALGNDRAAEVIKLGLGRLHASWSMVHSDMLNELRALLS